jgi:ribosomal protein S18 acetylase RimI-like enzyme
MDIDPRLLEAVADRAWPAQTRAGLGGWRLNASSGWSSRINACWPLESPDRDPEAAIDAVEAWYADRGLPPRFKLTDGATAPTDLADRLAARGYTPRGETLVMVGPLAGGGDTAVTVSAAPDPAFEVVLAATANLDDAAERLAALARIPPPALFARLDVDGQVAALGACAVDGEWVGVFGMRTAPDHRRRGLARRVLAALLRQASEHGARRAYLQVEAANAPAVALYAGQGFVPAYAYRYWMAARR